MAIIEEVKDMASGVEKKLGKGGLVAIVLCAGAFGLYSYYKAGNSGDDLVQAEKIDGYPEVGENSDVVISTLQNDMYAHSLEIMTGLQEGFKATNDYMNTGFRETNETITAGFNDMSTDLHHIGEIVTDTHKTMTGKNWDYADIGRNPSAAGGDYDHTSPMESQQGKEEESNG